MRFNTAQGKVIENVVEYIKEHIGKFPGEEFNIYVGSDSQDTNRQTVYATAIVIHRVGKGAHVIFKKDKVDKIKDDYERLWGEPERSMAVAEYLRNGGIEKFIELWQPDGLVIDLDFNENPRWLSHRLLKAAKGYIKGMGYKVRAKPASWRSVYMADRLCRGK